MSDMNKLLALLTLIAALVLTTSASASMKTLTVAMHDPGCHWFLVHGHYLKHYATKGSVSLRDMDENTLKIASKSGVRYVKVGHSIALKSGHYVIMMKDQAVDDNYLTLIVR